MTPDQRSLVDGVTRNIHTLSGMQEIEGGYRVKTSADGRHYIDILEMLFNWRIVTTVVSMPVVYDRGWCYFGTEGGKLTSYLRACIAAAEWDGADGTEPEGYDKALHPL